MVHSVNRRDALRIGGAALLATGGAVLLGACTSDRGASGGSASAAGDPVKGGTLVLGEISNGAAETMNLSAVQNGADFARIPQIYQGLWELHGDKFESVPVLVTEHEVRDRGKSHVIKLRRDVTFHDGKPFGADDVVWTVQAWQNNVTFGSVANLIDYAGVRKIDAYTVEIPMTFPIVDLPGIVAGNIASYIIPNGAKYETPKPVGTGPFKFDSFTPGVRSEFSAYDGYWEGRPYVDKLVIDSSFEEEATRFNALSSGAIDVMANFPFTLFSQGQSNPALVVANAPSPRFQGPAMRVDRPPFNDPRVSEAMKLLVDREVVMQTVYGGLGEISNDVGMRGVEYYAADLKRDRDVEKAKSLLKAAGADGLQVELFATKDAAGNMEMATVYAQQAKEAGVDVRVRQLSTAEYYQTSGPNPYGERTFGIADWLPMTLTTYHTMGLWTGAEYNETHWGDEKSDALFFDAISETDPARAEDKWHEIQVAQFERGGYIIPVSAAITDGYRNNIGGIKTTSSGTCDNYYLAKTWKR